MDLIKELNSKLDKAYLNTELGKKADRTALSSLQTTVNTKADKTELENKVDRSEIEQMQTQTEILMRTYKKLSNSIYVEAHLATTLRPWNGLGLQTHFQFNNLKIKHNTDDLGKNENGCFSFTA
ncbi:MAG: hypothetical protein ACRCSV_02970 [Chlamydiales bacterium]